MCLACVRAYARVCMSVDRVCVCACAYIYVWIGRVRICMSVTVEPMCVRAHVCMPGVCMPGVFILFLSSISRLFCKHKKV